MNISVKNWYVFFKNNIEKEKEWMKRKCRQDIMNIGRKFNEWINKETKEKKMKEVISDKIEKKNQIENRTRKKRNKKNAIFLSVLRSIFWKAFGSQSSYWLQIDITHAFNLSFKRTFPLNSSNVCVICLYGVFRA